MTKKLRKAYITLGNNITWIRENTGLTEKEMADILGVNRITLKIIEKGHIPRKMLLKVVLRIQDKFKLDIATIITKSYRDT